MAVPTDRGWAWAVVAGSFLLMVVVMSLIRSISILFVELFQVYQESAATTSLLYTVTATFSMLTAPIIAALVELKGCRPVALIGCLFLCLGLVLASFGNSLYTTILPFGILSGLGVGLTAFPPQIIVARYFDRKRSLANGMVYAGSGVGGILGPFLVHFVLDYFGLSQALFFFGAFSLHAAIGASLFRPLSFYEKPKVLVSGTAPESQNLLKPPSESQSFFYRVLFIKNASGERVPLVDLKLFKELSFLLLALSRLLCISSYYICLLTPTYGLETLHLSKTQTTILLSIFAITDTIARILVGIVSDKPFLKSRRVLAMLVYYSAASLATSLSFFAVTFETQAIYLGVHALFHGAFISTSPIVLRDLVGLGRLPSALSLLFLTEGIGHLIYPVVIGFIRDYTGSYLFGYVLVAIALSLAAVCISGIIIKKYFEKDEQNSEQ